MVAPLRIVFFGTPEFAVPTLRNLLASRHPVVGVVTQPDRPRGRGHKVSDAPIKVLALEHQLPVFQPERLKPPEVLETIRAWHPDLGVVAAYGRIIPETLLELPRLGMINVHASLLPAYRGAAPVHRAVMAGDAVTGVTIMRVVTALDAGPMFASITRAIDPDETSVDVERGLAAIGADLAVEVVDALAAGTAVETPQDDSRATYAPKITREEGTVDWTLPARTIHDRVRGLQPWPLVSVRMEGVRYQVHQTSVPGEPTEAAAGSLVEATGDRLDVAAGDGQRVRIVRIQPEGRRVMTARELLAGRRIPAGTRLEPA